MVGEKQTDLINELLRSRLQPAVYDQRRILCGNPAQFQGDERDVIFISLVDSKDDGAGPLSLRQDGTDGMYKKRFNVASSRAKDQLWVIYSLDAQTQLKPNDIRRRLIEHAINPSSLMDQLNAGLHDFAGVEYRAGDSLTRTFKGDQFHSFLSLQSMRINFVSADRRLTTQFASYRLVQIGPWHAP